jgi:hypothetical protein
VAFTFPQSLDLIRIMERYLERIRPEIHIRPELDFGYDINGQSVILQEIRPRYQAPEQIIKSEYAKATYHKSADEWKVYWMRASGKWNAYTPCPVVKDIQAFLELVDVDEFRCFKG